jgi:hypothetical protein
VERKLTEEPVDASYPPQSVASPAAAQKARRPLTRSAPEVVHVPPSVVQPKKAPHPPARLRWDDPLIASKGPVFGGGYGINGGRET